MQSEQLTIDSVGVILDLLDSKTLQIRVLGTGEDRHKTAVLITVSECGADKIVEARNLMHVRARVDQADYKVLI